MGFSIADTGLRCRPSSVRSLAYRLVYSLLFPALASLDVGPFWAWSRSRPAYHHAALPWQQACVCASIKGSLLTRLNTPQQALRPTGVPSYSCSFTWVLSDTGLRPEASCWLNWRHLVGLWTFTLFSEVIFLIHVDFGTLLSLNWCTLSAVTDICWLPRACFCKQLVSAHFFSLRLYVYKDGTAFLSWRLFSVALRPLRCSNARLQSAKAEYEFELDRTVSQPEIPAESRHRPVPRRAARRGVPEARIPRAREAHHPKQ